MKELALLTTFKEYAGMNRHIELIAHSPSSKHVPLSGKDAITLDESLGKLRIYSHIPVFTVSLYIQISESEVNRPDKCFYLRKKLCPKMKIESKAACAVTYHVSASPDENGNYWYEVRYSIKQYSYGYLLFKELKHMLFN